MPRLTATKLYEARNPLKGRNKHLRRRFGITQDEYEFLLTRQGGVCAICKRPPPVKGHLAVDHNHITGQLRGLLCRACNTALGSFNEDRETLAEALRYLDLVQGQPENHVISSEPTRWADEATNEVEDAYCDSDICVLPTKTPILTAP
jgi:hypothetical protein